MMVIYYFEVQDLFFYFYVYEINFDTISAFKAGQIYEKKKKTKLVLNYKFCGIIIKSLCVSNLNGYIYL